MKKHFFTTILIASATLINFKPGDATVTTPSTGQTISNAENDRNNLHESNQTDNGPGTSENQPRPNQQIQEYEPFIVTSASASTGFGEPWLYKLPSKFDIKDNELKLATSYAYIYEHRLCPDIKKGDKEWQRKLSVLHDRVPATVGCLFLASFEENEKQMCTTQPQPWLGNEKLHGGKPALCGTKKHQRMISSEYYNCGSYAYVSDYVNRREKAEEVHSDNIPGFRPNHYTMYEVCYDFSQRKIVWTKHEILTSALLAHKHYVDQQNSSNDFQLNDFSVKTFRLDILKSTFIDLKKTYELAKEYMSIYTMVPKAHMALPYWKNATMHFINSAPLLPEFIPLMKAIHNGILLASFQLLLESPNETLEIYTKADTVISKMHTLVKFLPLVKGALPVKPEELFHPNIWYILVHYKNKNIGILIVLHNTREEAPTQKVCDITLPCNFRDWSDTPNLITDNNLKYAYCCPASGQEVLKLFGDEEFSIYENFDIQAKILQQKNSLPSHV